MEQNLKDFYLDKVIAIEDLEELDLVDDKLYLEKIELLLKIAEQPTERVWAEYTTVSQITKQPVLMNKATSVKLTKQDVVELLDLLNEKYKERISLLTPKKRIDLIFTPTDRGHAKNVNFEIVLPKLGDWRFGYTNVYSAELIFHEFSHTLDFGRGKSSSYGKRDIHTHDFTYLLDGVLLDFKDYILDRYIPSVQRKQILENQKLLRTYQLNKDDIEDLEAQKEREELKSKLKKQNEIYAQVGLTENSYPIHLLLTENRQEKLNYLKFIFKSATFKNSEERLLFKSIENKLSSNDDIILNKEEITLLNNLVSKANVRNKFIYSELPFNQQLTASTYIKDFENKLTDLSNGKIDDLEIKDKIRIRTYQDARLLKKNKYED